MSRSRRYGRLLRWSWTLRNTWSVTLRDTVLGLAEVTLPDGWRPARSLNTAAGIEAVDVRRGRYAIVFSEGREDFEPPMDLEAHSAATRKGLSSSLQVLAIRGPEYRKVDGFDAVQYELDALNDQTSITFLHTTVAGRRAFHQVLCWATRSRYARDVFERFLNGFREQHGPDPQFVIGQVPVTPPSNYEVH